MLNMVNNKLTILHTLLNMDYVSKITNEYWFTESDLFIRKNIASNNFLNDTLKEKLAMLHEQLVFNNSLEIFNQAQGLVSRNHKNNLSKYNGWLGNVILIILICMIIAIGIGNFPKCRTFYDIYIKRVLEFALFMVSLLFMVYAMMGCMLFIDF
jgi:hypothetical protein